MVFFFLFLRSRSVCWLNTGRWSSVAWYTMHHTTIHKKYIKFKFCRNFFFASFIFSLALHSLPFFCSLVRSICCVWAIVCVSVFLSFVVVMVHSVEKWNGHWRSIQLLWMSFVYENEHYFYPFHWIMFLVARKIFTTEFSGLVSSLFFTY